MPQTKSSLHVKIPADLKARLEIQAANEGMKLSHWLRNTSGETSATILTDNCRARTHFSIHHPRRVV
jgi:hypothetical protein